MRLVWKRILAATLAVAASLLAGVATAGETQVAVAANFSEPAKEIAAAFAKAYIPTLRSWSESTFAGALDPQRPAAERAAIIDRFYDSYESAVAANPQGHGMDYVHCFMQIRKRG